MRDVKNCAYAALGTESQEAGDSAGAGRVLSSAGFARRAASRFLRFLVERYLEGREGELKESVIAVEVFDRKPDYDPKLDAIVRTEAIRLRARLSSYYSNGGGGSPLVIELPKGGYKPVIRQQAAARERRARPARIWLAASMAATLALAAGTTWWWVRQRAPLTVAVLPLKNLSARRQALLPDGRRTKSSSLSVIDGLTVRSRTSSFALKEALEYRRSRLDFGADCLLEGSVLRDEQLRINAD